MNFVCFRHWTEFHESYQQTVVIQWRKNESDSCSIWRICALKAHKLYFFFILSIFFFSFFLSVYITNITCYNLFSFCRASCICFQKGKEWSLNCLTQMWKCQHIINIACIWLLFSMSFNQHACLVNIFMWRNEQFSFTYPRTR